MGLYPGIAWDGVVINSGTVDASTLKIDNVEVVATAAELNAVADASSRIVSAITTLAVTQALHDNKVIVLNLAAGFTSTLPAATGSGAVFRFTVGTTVTSNNYIIAVADATDVMSGALFTTDQAAGTGTTFSTVAASDTITMNGTTTGGLAGGIVTLIDVATNLYAVSGNIIATGTEATPFSAAVS